MTDMTPRRFEWALRTRGTDLALWPDAEREAALLLLRHDQAAREAMADALMNEETPQADPSAQTRIQGGVRRALRPPAPVLRGMRWGAIAACLAAGLYFGLPALELDPGSEAMEPGPTMQATSPATVLAALDQ